MTEAVDGDLVEMDQKEVASALRALGSNDWALRARAADKLAAYIASLEARLSRTSGSE